MHHLNLPWLPTKIRRYLLAALVTPLKILAAEFQPRPKKRVLVRRKPCQAVFSIQLLRLLLPFRCAVRCYIRLTVFHSYFLYFVRPPLPSIIICLQEYSVWKRHCYHTSQLYRRERSGSRSLRMRTRARRLPNPLQQNTFQMCFVFTELFMYLNRTFFNTTNIQSLQCNRLFRRVLNSFKTAQKNQSLGL